MGQGGGEGGGQGSGEGKVAVVVVVTVVTAVVRVQRVPIEAPILTTSEPSEASTEQQISLSSSKLGTPSGGGQYSFSPSPTAKLSLCWWLPTARLLVDGSNSPAAEPFTVDPPSAEPFTAEPFTVDPPSAKPFTAEPFTAEPFTAEPFTVEPFTAEPFTADGSRSASTWVPSLSVKCLPPRATVCVAWVRVRGRVRIWVGVRV